MPTLLDTIVCENIRQEANNKVSLLGVFGEEVLIPKIPYTFASLGVFQRWTAADDESRRGSISCRVELRAPEGPHLSLPENQVILAPGRRLIVVAVQLAGVTVAQEGTCYVATFFDGRENIYGFQIRVPSSQEAQQLHLTGFG